MSLFKTFKVKNNEIFLSNGLIAVSVYIVFNTLVTDQLKVSEGGPKFSCFHVPAESPWRSVIGQIVYAQPKAACVDIIFV